MKNTPNCCSPVLKSIAIASLLSICPMQAGTLFTYAGKITESNGSLGFLVGDSVTYMIELSDNNFTPYNDTSADFYGWYDENLSSDQDMITSFSGSGTSGSWARPSTNDGAPFTFIEANNPSRSGLPNALKVAPGADTGNIGVSINTFPIISTYFEMQSNFNFQTASSMEPDANLFFSDYTGTYSNTASRVSNIVTDGGGTMRFLLDSVTITAVPEPSATLLGCLGMLALIRRRR